MNSEINKFEYRGFVANKIPVLLKIEYGKYDPEKISSELILLGAKEDFGRKFSACLGGDEYGNLKITGDKDDSHQVVLRNITGWTYQNNNAKLYIDSFEYGISDNPIKNPENIYITVELTPSGILKKWGARELHYDGSIKFRNDYPDEIEWDLDIGKGKAFTRYTYEEHKIFDNNATIQIERPCLTFEIDTELNLSTYEIKEIVENEARDFSLILSLCYRKLVNWYEIEFLIRPKNGSYDSVIPIIRKKVYTKNYPDHEDELINYRDLIKGGLPTLVEKFRSSPLIESLRRSITFLASSESNQTTEIKYFLSIISLESFCDGFVKFERDNVRIPSGKWKKIEKLLRNSLNALSKQKDLSGYIETIKKKLPELKRITTLDKIIYCCKTLGVNANDLWPKDGLKDGLNKALNMRNQLFHRAYYEDPYFLYANFIRIKILTERLILKHLHWPDEKIWRWYDQKMRRLKVD
ncbi:MAG: hypothetical protein GXO46_05630 [Chlorobi bacterium]|nr:hypothetical protein [Chlorobiota bacterium]